MDGWMDGGGVPLDPCASAPVYTIRNQETHLDEDEEEGEEESSESTAYPLAD